MIVLFLQKSLSPFGVVLGLGLRSGALYFYEGLLDVDGVGG
jgi:hypothetical protein